MTSEMLTAVGVNGLAAAIIIGAVLLFRVLRSSGNPITIAIIDELVEAAEQLLADASGEERLTYVLERAQKYLPDLDPDLIRTLIEAAVYRLNQTQASARRWTEGATDADIDTHATDSS